MSNSTVFFRLNPDGVASERIGTVKVTAAGQTEALRLIKAEARKRGMPEPLAVNRMSVAVRDWSEMGRREYQWAYVPEITHQT